MIQQWEFKETDIADLYEIQPFNAEDVRGCFTDRKSTRLNSSH